MSAFHNSEEGERVALAWHKLGTFLSSAALGVHLGCALVALGGVVWHRWAEKQHRQHLAELRNKKLEPGPPRMA